MCDGGNVIISVPSKKDILALSRKWKIHNIHLMKRRNQVQKISSERHLIMIDNQILKDFFICY